MREKLRPMEDYSKRKEELKDNIVMKKPLSRLDDDIVPKRRGLPPGRKKAYTPTRMKNAINKYFQWCEDNDEMPSIKGMMIHLKLYKDTFYDYIKYPEYSNMLEHARMIIANWAEQDVYNTKGMAAGKIAYMKNIHGWSDKIETNNTTHIQQITVDEAKAKIAMLAPKLLEILKNTTITQQLVIDAEVENGKE